MRKINFFVLLFMFLVFLPKISFAYPEIIFESIELYDIAGEFGINPGSWYAFDLFFAERQKYYSELRFDMPTPAIFVPCGPNNEQNVQALIDAINEANEYNDHDTIILPS